MEVTGAGALLHNGHCQLLCESETFRIMNIECQWGSAFMQCRVKRGSPPALPVGPGRGQFHSQGFHKTPRAVEWDNLPRFCAESESMLRTILGRSRPCKREAILHHPKEKTE